MSPVQADRWVHGTYGTHQVVGEAISKGGVGSIFRTTDPRWVYKEYHSPDKAPPAEHLEQLVDVGREVLMRQAQPIGSTPESSINWPVDIVRRPDGRIVGCVLPAIPQRFFHPAHQGVNTLDFLVMRRSKPPAAKLRMVVLLRMAEILAFVHSKGLVHGDVNAKNVAWTLSPEPAAYLIDCDGMVPQNPPPRTGVQANYWTDPRVVDRVVPAHDHYSDWYCLSLALYRGLLLPVGGNLAKDANGKWAVPSQIPADLDPRIAALLRRGLTDPLDPSRRPEPAEWVKTLMSVYIVGGTFDDAALVKLDRVLAVPRQPTVTQLTVTPPMTFQRLPPTPPPTPAPTWQPPFPGPRQPPPPPRPVSQPYQPPRQQFAPPPAVYPPVTPAQGYQFGSPVPVGGRPPGMLARWAMTGGAGYYVPLVLLTLCACGFGSVVSVLVLVQVLRTDRAWPGWTAALVSSAISCGIGGLYLLGIFADIVSGAGTSSSTP